MRERTYVQERGPRPTSFAKYVRRVRAEFDTLLASDPTEAEVQKFLESNPPLIPGANTPGGGTGHWPIHFAVFTQPRLIGFSGRQPDFMWMSTHSGSWFPAMVEIERPGKAIFTAKGVPSAEFNQARNQLIQWKNWLSVPANVQKFMDDYGVPIWVRERRTMGEHFILVYGLRAEFERVPELSRQRSLLLSLPQQLMSFDRLKPDKDLGCAVTVKAIGDGRLQAVAVADTFGVGPANAQYLERFEGLNAAIARNPHISAERAEFLRGRIAYWIRWSRSDALCVTGGDFLE